MVAEDDVLGDRERRDEPEVLVDHADPGVEGVARGVEANRLAVQLDVALVLPIEPGEDVRERRLPGAVLTEEGVHLSRRRLEAHAVVGEHAGEALRDPVHPYRRCERGAGRADASLRLQVARGLAPPAINPEEGPTRPCRPRP